MASRRAPLQGFGVPITATDLSGNVFFAVEVARNELAQWAMSPIVRQTNIPGSFPPIIEEEHIGWTPATLSWALRLDSLDDYRRLLAMVLTTQTLTVIPNTQSHVGEYLHVAGAQYEALPNTKLTNLTNPVRRLDGSVEVTAAFQRIINPATGLVVS